MKNDLIANCFPGLTLNQKGHVRVLFDYFLTSFLLFFIRMQGP